MEILNRKILSKYKREIVLFSFGILYFFFLLRYYLIEYYVPDFRLYFDMALEGSKAQDGFSSLFLWFAAFAASIPVFLSVFCLLLMTLSMINISIFINFLFKKINLYYCISLLVLYSCGAFYYFYGKIFYDFPFTAFTYSMCLLIARKLYSKLLFIGGGKQIPVALTKSGSCYVFGMGSCFPGNLIIFFVLPVLDY